MACDRCRKTREVSDASLSVTTGLTGSNDGISRITSERLWLCHACLRVFNRRWRKFKSERMKSV